MIQFEHVSKSYGKTPVLKDLNFTIPDGQFVFLIGPSGCGKTTTMKMINRLLEPDSGTIRIDGQDIHSQDKVELRRHIGYVIQQIGLFPNMTVAQNICVVPKLLKYDKARCDEIVQEMLQLVHMEQSANKYPSELSGGQQQRIGVLRALAASPPIVLMDEPFSALDPLTRESLQDEVKNLQQKLNKTIVFVSHDMSEALKLADIIIFMAAGEIVQMASPEERAIGLHTIYVLISVVIGFAAGLVFGILLSRIPRWLSGIIIPILSIFQTIPGLVFIGVLFIWWGNIYPTVIVALSVYAMFPVLKNTYTGILEVEPKYIEAAKGCGMSSFQTLVRVELPLAMPVIISGLRMAAIYTVSWAVLASMIGLGGLGDFVYRGTSSNNNTLILLGAIPAAILAVLFGLVIDLLQKRVTPRGLRKEAGK